MATDGAVSRRKKTNEEFRISWDFVNDLEAGDSIATQAVTARDSDGVDVTGTFLQSPAIQGTKIVVQVQGGVSGKDYTVAFKATTTQGDVFDRTVLVQVRAD
jgi:hypothetical protein